jgi:2-aminoadipate transaminase
MTYRFSRRVEGLQSSAIREILAVVNRPDVISFAGGLPAPELFPTQPMARIARELLEGPDGSRALQYSETEGHLGLREHICRALPLPQGSASVPGVLVTQGSQQGLDLITKLLVDPGDEVLVESPAYLGALQVFRFFGAKVTFLRCDDEGVDPDDLRAALQRRPKLLYLTPTFQNPSGLCYTAARRQALRQVLQGSDVLVLEDDPYRELWYDAPPPPPLCDGLDPARWVYLGSFSKTAMPGLRVGFLVGPPELVRRCVQVKQATDLQTNTLGQHLIYGLVRDPTFAEHLVRLRRSYAARRDAMDAALREQLSGRLTWRRAAGGMFVWGRLAQGDAAELLPLAVEEGLAFVPGGEFHEHGQGRATIRLNFTHASEPRLREGVARLARAMARYARR